MIQVNRNNREYKIHYCEHMVHHQNLKSIFQNGLLSHNIAYEKGLIKEDISMDEVQQRRSRRYATIDGKKYFLHDFVSFYFNTRNPMLYRRKNIQNELVILLVDIDIIDKKICCFTDGNAASRGTKAYLKKEELSNIPFEITTATSWNHEDLDIKRENVRKMCSEILIYPKVEISEISKIICPNQKMVNYVNALKADVSLNYLTSHIEVKTNSAYFF